MIKKHVKKFGKDFKKFTQTGLVAAFGLITASSWKDVLDEWLIKVEQVSPIQGKIITAVGITGLSALVMSLSSRILKWST